MKFAYRNPPSLTENMTGEATMLVSLVFGAGSLLVENPNYCITAISAGTYVVGAATKFFANFQITSDNSLESEVNTYEPTL